jgi:hypothetical protein
MFAGLFGGGPDDYVPKNSDADIAEQMAQLELKKKTAARHAVAQENFRVQLAFHALTEVAMTNNERKMIEFGCCYIHKDGKKCIHVRLELADYAGERCYCRKHEKFRSTFDARARAKKSKNWDDFPVEPLEKMTRGKVARPGVGGSRSSDDVYSYGSKRSASSRGATESATKRTYPIEPTLSNSDDTVAPKYG